MKLQDQVAIIIGSGSGIGQAIAHLFASEGAHVIVADIAPELAAETVSQIKACCLNNANLAEFVPKMPELGNFPLLVDSVV